MFVHSNMKKNHMDFSDMKLTIQVEEKKEEEEKEDESPKRSSSFRDTYEEDVQPLISQRKKRTSKLQDSEIGRAHV